MDSKYIVRLNKVSPSYYEEIREVYEEPVYHKPRQYTNNSRYQRVRTLQDDKGNIYHENWIKREIDKSTRDSLHIITMIDENRLDMVATSYYGTPRYWWVIALANNIIDPFEVPVGTELRIPLIESLYNKGGILSGN